MRSRQRWCGVLAVLWIVAVSFIFLLPALRRGPELGTTDLLAGGGLTATQGAAAYNPMAADQIRAFQPWASLSWSQVHAGEMPLWNPHSGLGLPLLHNFQSAALSVPMIIGYLTPHRYVYTTAIVTTMLIAGLGALWFCRRLGLRLLPSTFAATSFMLSGSFSGWLGWPMAGTACWLGWALGCVIMLIDAPRRIEYAGGLAIVLASMAYAGHPETLLICYLCIAVFAIAALARQAMRQRDRRCALTSTIALCLSGVAALGLAAPLLLPGLEVVGRATRGVSTGFTLPASASANVLLAGYHGYPTRGSNYFGPSNYFETAAYVGLVALVLVCVALVHSWRKPSVLGLSVVAVLCAVLAYSANIFHLLDHVPLLKTIQWTRALIVFDFALAILAGFGLQAVLDRSDGRATRRAWWVSTLALSSVVGIAWLHHARASLDSRDAEIRATSLKWAAAQLGVLVVVGIALSITSQRRSSSSSALSPRSTRTGAAALLAVETVFLLTAAPSLWASSSDSFPVTPAVARLKEVVGNDRVGFARCETIVDVPSLGILAGTNAGYRVSEVSAFDPILPKSYFRSYYDALGEPSAVHGRGGFCPSLTTAELARHFGVSYVLAASGSPPPSGMVFEETIGGEDLYFVPAAGIVTVQPDTMPASSPDATVATLSGDVNDPASLRTVVDVTTPSTMYFRVTNYDGWTATIDGRGLPLDSWAEAMLSASVPPGHHVIEMRYRPPMWTVGLLLAGASAVAVGVALLSPLWRSHRAP